MSGRTPRRIECLLCGDVRFPSLPQDWRPCRCGTVSVVAGRVYVSYRRPRPDRPVQPAFDHVVVDPSSSLTFSTGTTSVTYDFGISAARGTRVVAEGVAAR